MNLLVIVLRLIHIVAGVFWVGASIVLGVFISPAIAATAEAGQKFMTHLVAKAKITMAITVAAILTVLAGSILYFIDAGGFDSAWSRSGPGVGFGLGGLLAFVGLFFGALLGKNLATVVETGGQVQGKPTPEQLAKIQSAQKRLAVVGPISMIALILALICMATARYWRF